MEEPNRMLSWYQSLTCIFAMVILSSAKTPGSISRIQLQQPGGSSGPILPWIKKLRYIDPLVTSDTPSSVIPFSRAGNLIVIRAKAGTTEGNFILDTGAPGLVLNITYFRDLPLVMRETGESGGITGATSDNHPSFLEDLSFGPIHYYNVEADRVNLGHLENSKGIRIHGLLGMQLFKRFEMIIDYDKSLIHLHLISRKESAAYRHDMLKDTSLYDEFSIQIDNNKLLTYGFMAGKRLTFLIDTGAESNVLDSRLPDKIFEQVSITNRLVLAGSGAQKVDALGGSMRGMKLGKVEMDDLPVLVTNLAKMCYAYDKCLDGMLGFDFLSRQKIGFNFVKRKMYIWR
jgi:predicted aspartyl protease